MQLSEEPLVTGWVRTTDLLLVVTKETFMAPTEKAASEPPGVDALGLRLLPGAEVVVMKRSGSLARVRYESAWFRADGWIPDDSLGTFFEKSQTGPKALQSVSVTPETTTLRYTPGGKPIVTIKRPKTAGRDGWALAGEGIVEKKHILVWWTDGYASVHGWFPEAQVTKELPGLLGNVVATIGSHKTKIDVPGGTQIFDQPGRNNIGQFVVGGHVIVLEERDGSTRIHIATKLGQLTAWVPITGPAP